MHDRATDRRFKIRIGSARCIKGRAVGKARPIGLSLLTLLALPIMVNACVFGRPDNVPWYAARRDPSGLAPDPATTPEAVIQVYAARAVRWRGAFAVHSWVVVKPSAAQRYTRYEVLGFGVANGAPAVRMIAPAPTITGSVHVLRSSSTVAGRTATC
jgi:hypothetical protein